MKMCYEMVGHIFGNMDRHDQVLRNHTKRITKLESRSGRAGKWVALGLVVFILQEMHLRDLEKRTEAAEKKVRQIEAVLNMETE